jgi:hypothetical protein
MLERLLIFNPWAQKPSLPVRQLVDLPDFTIND